MTKSPSHVTVPLNTFCSPWLFLDTHFLPPLQSMQRLFPSHIFVSFRIINSGPSSPVTSTKLPLRKVRATEQLLEQTDTVYHANYSISAWYCAVCRTCVGNFSPAMGASNTVGIGLSYRPASLRSLATQFQTRLLESIPRPIAGLKFSTLSNVTHFTTVHTLECTQQWKFINCLRKK